MLLKVCFRNVYLWFLFSGCGGCVAGEEEFVQCPCGRIIRDAGEYRLVFLRRGAFEVDILCPNEVCYLKELGYVKFRFNDGEIVLESAEFYPPFVTWNSSRLGFEKTSSILKEHLRTIVRELIDWNEVKRALGRNEK